MSAAGLIELAAKHTVARMLERDDFSKRYARVSPSRSTSSSIRWCRATTRSRCKADVELGGTDQKFNLLVGRQLQEATTARSRRSCSRCRCSRASMACNKMSKSLDNYVGIDGAARRDVRQAHVDLGRADVALLRAAELQAQRRDRRLREEAGTGRNPRDVKFELAGEIVERFHGKAAAETAHAEFVGRFQKGQVPADLRQVTVESDAAGMKIANVLKEAGLASSTTAAYRLIEQGGVRIDGEKLTDAGLALRPGATHVVQVGKREFAQVTVRSRGA